MKAVLRGGGIQLLSVFDVRQMVSAVIAVDLIPVVVSDEGAGRDERISERGRCWRQDLLYLSVADGDCWLLHGDPG